MTSDGRGEINASCCSGQSCGSHRGVDGSYSILQGVLVNLVGVQGEKPAPLLEGRAGRLRLSTATVSNAQGLSVSLSVVT